MRGRMIDVFVFGLQGEIFTVRVRETYTVSKLKAIIEEKTGIDTSVIGQATHPLPTVVGSV